MKSMQLFPALEAAVEAALKASIARFGVLVPVVKDQHDRILDGHHRSRIADELGVKYRVDVVMVADEEEARAIVETLNTDRGHRLKSDMRRDVVADLREEGHSLRAIAGAVGVSLWQVQRDLSGVSEDTPERVIGKDGKSYQAQRGKNLGVHFSTGENDWHTPETVISRVTEAFGEIDLDPCSNIGEPNVPAGRHYTEEDNGLAHTWNGRVYMNPPYGRPIAEWVEKLCSEYESGAVTEAIALVPARTDTEWFQRLRNAAICFIDGRLKFSGHANSAPFPSCACYLGPDIAGFVEAFGDLGDIWVRWSE